MSPSEAPGRKSAAEHIGFAATLHAALSAAGQTVHTAPMSSFEPARYRQALRILTSFKLSGAFKLWLELEFHRNGARDRSLSHERHLFTSG